MLLSVVVLAKDGNYAPSNGVVYSVFLGVVLCHGILASTISTIMGKLQTVFVVMNFILIFATIIALPIGRASQRNDAEFIFTNINNLTAWPTGWTFILAWLSPVWTVGGEQVRLHPLLRGTLIPEAAIPGFDSCVHMSEEAANATRAVPWGIVMAVGSCWVFGFIIMIVIAACMSPDSEHILGSKFGQPMAQIYYDAIGKSGAIGLMTLLFCVQFMMGLSILVAVSRQSWAFSRDGALPFSRWVRVVSKRNYVPIRAVWFCVILTLILGLLCLIAPASALALFSLAVAGNNLAWGLPIFCRVVWGQKKFKPGPFYTGRFSTPIAWIAIIFLVFSTTLVMFPAEGPDPAAAEMNYSIVICAAVWLGAW